MSLAKLYLPVFEARKRGIQYKDLNIQNSCNYPEHRVTINTEGECFICNCDAYLPVSVGNILDFDKLEEVWTNTTARYLQNDVRDKKFTYCAVDHCEIRSADLLNDIYHMSINIDESCNLACASCRPGPINHTQGPIFDHTSKLVSKLIYLLENFTQPMTINMCGNGDVLASAIMRPLILNWNVKDNQTIYIQTNGLLMKKLLPNSKILPNIQTFQISVDAGSKEVYEQVRRPGKFDVLIDNLSWLNETRAPGVDVLLYFCLYDSNATDIINFANLCTEFGFNGEIGRIENWYSFSNFDDRDVMGNLGHPLRSSALEQLEIVRNFPNIKLRDSILNML